MTRWLKVTKQNALLAKSQVGKITGIQKASAQHVQKTK
jgi:hypothetical protein